MFYKKTIVFSFSVLLTSCGVVEYLHYSFLEKGSYSYDYLYGKKEIDFRTGKWLIVGNNQDDITFFKKFLGARLSATYEALDKNGKLAVPFDVTYKTPAKDLQLIGKDSGYDFLICFNHIRKDIEQKWTQKHYVVDYIDKYQTSEFYIFNLHTGDIEYKLTCIGQSDTQDDNFYEINSETKLFSKIRKKAVYDK